MFTKKTVLLCTLIAMLPGFVFAWPWSSETPEAAAKTARAKKDKAHDKAGRKVHHDKAERAEESDEKTEKARKKAEKKARREKK